MTIASSRAGRSNGPLGKMWLESQKSVQYFSISGVILLMSLRVMLRRPVGPGFTGNGCVGQFSSPGSPLRRTGRSSMPYTASPVTRSKMYAKCNLPVWRTAGITRPFRRTSIKIGCVGMS